VLALAACQHDIADTDGAFYAWNDRRVHCAVDIDTSTRNDWASIETGLDRARDRGEVLELYAHHPGVTVRWDLIEQVLAGAQQRGLPFLTYADLAHGGLSPSGGLLLSFDDDWVDAWTSGRELFQRYGARVTFFIAYYPHYTDAMKAELHTLAADGHDVEAHSITHARAPAYVESRGLTAYLDEDVLPSITLLENDGYPVTTFAYPFGSRTAETDRAILEHVTLLRSVAFSWTGVESPCPF
jgi:peptidoglycan/xylan/chitin deacetylase (PgdA/CDA1 family)